MRTSHRTHALRAPRPAHRYRTSFEPLEPRQLLTGAINTAFSFGSSKDDFITGIVVDANNITYVTGTFTGTITASTGGGNFSLTSNGGTDVFIAAFNGNSLLWANSFGGTDNDISGDIVLVNNTLWIDGTFRKSMDADTGNGTTTLVSTGAGDAYLSQFAASGAFVNAFSFGGTGEDTALKIAADAAANVFLLGTFSGTADLDPSNGTTFRTANNLNGNVYLTKVAPTGNLVWANTYGYADSLLPADVAVTPAGIPVFAGTFRGGFDVDGTLNGTNQLTSTRYLGFVAIMNADGTLKSAKTIGQPLSGNFDPIRVQALALDPAGNILLGGKYSGPVDIDPGNNVVTITTLPELQNATGNDAFEGFVLKLNAAGVYLWSGALRGNGSSEVLAIASDSGGGVYIAGDLQHTADFDFSIINHSLTAPLNSTLSSFVAKYDRAGHWIWATGATAGSGNNLATGIVITRDFRPIVAGNFDASVAFSTSTTGLLPVVSTTTLNTNGLNDPFILSFLPSQVAPTAVSLVGSSSTIVRGTSVIVTVTIAGPATPTGTITFFDGATNLGAVAIPANSNKLSVPLQLLAVGVHTVSARYNGDSNYSPANSKAITVTVTVPQTPVGTIDVPGPGMLVGWAADYQALNTPLTVQIFIDNTFRQALVADIDRPDLATFLPGSTNHGYSWQLPTLTAGDHPVKVVAFDPITHAGTVIATRTIHIDNLYFDEAFYRASYPDVALAIKAGKIKSGWQHFITTGAHEGRNPSPYFNELWYRSHNPDVAAAIVSGKLSSGFAHFNATGAREGRDPSVFFSSSWYLRAYPGVKSAVNAGTVASAFAHFLLNGMFENRMPTAWFDGSYYLANNANVVAGIAKGTIRSAYDHFVSTGLAEVRSPGSWYSESAYLARYADVQSAVNAHTFPSGLDHFVNIGFAEGRNSSATFDEAAYVIKWPAAQTAIDAGQAKSPFQYYLLYGRLLGQEP